MKSRHYCIIIRVSSEKIYQRKWGGNWRQTSCTSWLGPVRSAGGGACHPGQERSGVIREFLVNSVKPRWSVNSSQSEFPIIPFTVGRHTIKQVAAGHCVKCFTLSTFCFLQKHDSEPLTAAPTTGNNVASANNYWTNKKQQQQQQNKCPVDFRDGQR